MMIKSAARRTLQFRSGREVLLIGVAYMAYEVVRSFSSGRALDALANTEIVVRVERGLGIFAELNVQVAILGWQGVADLLSLWYFWGHFPLIVSLSIWMFVRHRADYLWARNAIFAAGAIALVVYLTFPVAPPRLLPGAGFVDTLRDAFALQYDDSSLVNQFAALPSMHQGFAIIIGVALYRVIGGRRGTALLIALPALMFVTIVATGNHWFLDAVLGALVTVVAMFFASRVERYGLPLPRTLRQLLSVGESSSVGEAGAVFPPAVSRYADGSAPALR